MTKQYKYETTGDAYDCIMCGVDGVKTGDIIIIESEQVVGLAWTWPVAITEADGDLHQAADGLTLADICHGADNTGSRVFTDEQIAAAVAVATELGYPIH